MLPTRWPAVDAICPNGAGVAFMFPGGGSQYPGMAAALDERFTEFHRSLDEGIRLVKKHSGLDLTPLLKPDGDADALRQPSASLPAVFITEVALARQWMAWGVQPKMLVGHSLGEYTAAHLADVLSFDDAVKLVVTRAALMERVGGENAAMMAVPMPEAELRALLPASLSLATVNAADECVVSGHASDVDAFTIVLAGQGITGSRIPLAAAAHSSLLDPVLAEFAAVVRTVKLSAPTLRYVSNLTGSWITAEQATDPQYWVDHLRGTVRFSDGLAAALATGPLVLVELGPGQSLSSYARRQETKPIAVIPGLRHPADAIDDTVHVLAAFAKLWAFGVPVDLTTTIGPGGARRRLRMPTYPFDRERYWIEPGMFGMGAAGTGAVGGATSVAASASESTGTRRIERLEDWCWEPIWRDAPAPVLPSGPVGPWLILADAGDADAAAMAVELRRRGEIVRVGTNHAPDLFEDADHGGAIKAVAVFAPVRDGAGNSVTDTFERARARLLHDSSLALRSLANGVGEGRLVVLTRGALSAEDVAPRAVEAMALGPVLVGPREYPDLQTLLVDVLASEMPSPTVLADELLGAQGTVVARRGARRLAPDLQRRVLPATSPAAVPFRNGGTYVVTGALGGIGHSIASHLATNHHANLVVVASEALPEPHERAHFLATHSPAHPTSRRLQRLAALEADGSRVLAVSADLSDPASLRAALDEAESTFGRIDGAVHAAGRLVDRLLETVTAEDQEAVIGAKARGAVVLADELARRGAEHLVLVSSTSTSLAPGGQSSYVAANAVLDSLAGAHGALRVVTIDFGVWAGTGMAAAAARRARLGVEDGEAIEHPVLAERRIDRTGALEFTGRIDAKTDWIVDEHRVSSGMAVLPGTGHLELMLAALEHAGTALDTPTSVGARYALADVSLLEPLVVPDEHAVMVRVTIAPPEPDGTRLVRVESDGGLGRVWYVHSEAELVRAAPRPAPNETLSLRDASPIDPLIGPRRHLRLGARWDAVDEASATADAVLARLALRSGVDDSSAWCAHPALVDVATACGVALGTATGDVLYVPVGYDTVTSYAPLGAAVTVLARRQPSSTADLLRVDLSFLASDGELALAVSGLSLRPVTDPGRFAAPTEAGSSRATGRVSQLLELAEDLGIRESEGVELFERVVASGASRLVVSSVELDDLRDEPDANETSSRANAHSGGSGGGLLDVLAEAWGDLLGVSPIGLDDDFFELGGHSLIAIRLMTRIHKTIGVRLQLATLFEAPTIRKLAEVLLAEKPELAELGAAPTDADAAPGVASRPTDGAAARSAIPAAPTRHPSIVPIRPATTDQRPLFLIHGAGGNVLNLWGLAKQLPAGRAVYGIQAHGIDGSVPPDDSVEQMAARYIEAIRSVQPHGPYLLGGYSGGGVVALHMSILLAATGERVAKVIMLDTVPRLSGAPRGALALRNAAINGLRRGPWAVLPWLRYTLVQKYGRKTIDLDAFGLGFGDTSDLGFVNLETHFAGVIDSYQFGVYDVDVLIVEAEKVFAAWPWHYGWRDKVRGHIERVIVPGDHFEMFTADHAPVVARAIAPHLAAFDKLGFDRPTTESS
jgi:thioesterase domain-containing protein/malonyl CoA-acyl carrier protein transacylase/aryl carrier-like protein